jgi:four helix bundle protein
VEHFVISKLINMLINSFLEVEKGVVCGVFSGNKGCVNCLAGTLGSLYFAPIFSTPPLLNFLTNMAYTYSFEKLQVWQKSISLVKSIYLMTQKFPKEELFGLSSQIRRAAVSIPTNLAEGVARKSSKDQAHFSNIAYSSLTELLNLLIIAHELNMLPTESYESLRNQIEEISRMINALKTKQSSRV